MALTLQAQDTDEPFADTDYELLGNPQYRVVSGCAVTYDAANLTVDVAAGVIKHNGTYVSVSEQLNVVTIAVDGSNPRWSYLTINGAGTVILTSGAAAATPVKPEAPEGVFLAMLLVVNGDAIANDIAVKLDKRIWSEVTDVAPQATAIGDSQALGTGDQAAREDHVHASAAPAAPTAITYGTAAAAGASADAARRDHAHGFANPAAASTLAIGDAAAAGSGGDAAREDHVHAMVDPATPTTLVIDTAAAVGIGTDAAREDHVHGMTAPATPNVIQIGDAAAVGVGDDAAREDHEHGLVAPANPTTQDFGDAPATGSGTDPAREDHLHGMPADGAATIVEQDNDQTISDSTALVNSDDLKFTMAANKRYAVEVFILCESSSTANFRAEFDLAGTSTFDGMAASTSTGGTAQTQDLTESEVRFFRPGNGAGVPAGGFFVAGVASADGTGGTFQVRFAQGTATVEDTKLLIGSWLRFKLLN